MNKLRTYLPFHFLLALILGVCLQYYTGFWQYGFLKIGVLFAVFILLLFVLHKQTKQKLFTFFSWLCIVFIGVFAVYINDARNYNTYYGNFATEKSAVVVTIDKVLKPGNYYHKYEAEVVQIDSRKTKGRILLNIQKDSAQKLLKVDEKLFLKPLFKELISPLNPHQFSYKDYLAKQGIYNQIFVDNQQFKHIGKRSFSLVGLSATFRNTIQQSLRKYNFSNNEFAVINALLLGQRQEISKELLQDYSRAGAIHILAVSGLHVGIILLLLSYLFKPLEKLNRGIYIKTFCIVVLLWMFAFIAGLSASVVRAVTMFTFVAIGQLFKRKNNVEYSLVTSMFVLLLIKPMFLFDVGFQLSYLAVFGIVWVQPKLYKLWKPKLKLTDKLWQLFTVSVSAQAGILPISLYYFHQFPSLFVLSNLVIIPFLGGILLGGIIIIILSLTNLLPQFLADFYGKIIDVMNQFVSWVSHQEDFLFRNISMSFWLMLAWYLVIIFGYRFLFIKRKPKQLIYFLVAILCVQSVSLFQKYKTETTNEFLVFHKSRKLVLANRVGENLHVFSDMDSTEVLDEKLVNSYLIGERVSLVIRNIKPAVFQFNNQQIIIIDSLGVYNVKGNQNFVVLLQYSPKINLKRMISMLNPTQIIADGTNYKSYINRWEVICAQEKTPFHYTGQNGVFILSD